MLSDAPEETFLLNLPSLSAGEHTVAVQIIDRFGNTAAAKVTFAIPAHSSN
jgi:hypothetical protein